MKIILSIICFFGLAVFLCNETFSETYYADSVLGKDSNNGITSKNPWQSLSYISSGIAKRGVFIYL